MARAIHHLAIARATQNLSKMTKPFMLSGAKLCFAESKHRKPQCCWHVDFAPLALR
jgi:hypothetical protein